MFLKVRFLMHFTYRLTVRIVLFLFVLLALVVAHPDSSKAGGGVGQASALGNSQTSKHLPSTRKRLSLSILPECTFNTRRALGRSQVEHRLQPEYRGSR